jgi:ComF family protein
MATPRCGDCLVGRPSWDRLFSLWEYRRPGDAIVHGLKFSRLAGLGVRLAAELWERYAEELAEADVVVPAPLPWTRRLARGFNHARVIAAPLASLLGKPCQEALARRPARPLSLAPKDERFRLISLSMTALSRSRLEQQCVLLVDDVVTTGATLRVASRLLSRLGARRILAVAPFATPPVRQACGAGVVRRG